MGRSIDSEGLERIGRAMAVVMRENNYTIETLQKPKAPKGFPQALIAASGDTSRDAGTMSTYFRRHRDQLLEIAAKHLSEPQASANVLSGDKVDSGGSAGESPLVVESESLANETGNADTADNVNDAAPCKAESGARLDDLASLVALHGERIGEIQSALRDIDANIANAGNVISGSVMELLAEHKTETQSRMDAIHARLDEIGGNIANVVSKQSERSVGGVGNAGSGQEEPPRPPKQGRKFAGHQGHLRGIVDAVVLDMLMKESERYAGNVSRALTAILWQHFGRPDLSFSIPESELEILKAKYPAQDRGK